MLLPEALLHTPLFAVLAAFVAINTVMYSALALGKLLPKVYITDWVSHRNQRSETRSIYPDGEAARVTPLLRRSQRPGAVTTTTAITTTILRTTPPRP